MERQSGAFTFPQLVPFWGVVENRVDDEKKLGRVRVRIYGYYTGDQGKMPSDQLPWAFVMQDITSAANSGVGRSPTGIVEGTTVFGYFLDGESAQVPLVVGTIAGYNKGEGFEGAFKDLSGKYPREPGENDVNRLARAERVSETVVQKKRDSVDTANVAFQGNWTEQATPYDASYPFNHVYESESGHIEEFDDTKGKERYHLYHRTGSFEEIHPDGTKVTKVVKDNYEVVHGDDYILVKGDCKVNIQGKSSVLIEGDADIEIKGNCKEKIHGNYDLEVLGTYNVDVKGWHHDHSHTHRRINAPRIDLN